MVERQHLRLTPLVRRLRLPLLLVRLLRQPAILSNKLKLKFAYFLSFNLLIYSLFLP
jgi:hypothetical protein